MRAKFNVGTLVVATKRAPREFVKTSGLDKGPKFVKKVIPHERGYGNEGAGYMVGGEVLYSYELRRLHRKRPA